MDINFLEYWKTVAEMAMQLPGAAPSTSYGTPAFKVNKKLFVRLKEDGKTIVVFSNERDKWMKQAPAVFFITDHYKNYPLMLIDLVRVKNEDLKILLLTSWQIQAPTKLQKSKL